MAVNLRTVISELNFAAQLSTDNPSDARLKPLLKSAIADLKTAATALVGDLGDDPGIGTK